MISFLPFLLVSSIVTAAVSAGVSKEFDAESIDDEFYGTFVDLEFIENVEPFKEALEKNVSLRNTVEELNLADDCETCCSIPSQTIVDIFRLLDGSRSLVQVAFYSIYCSEISSYKSRKITQGKDRNSQGFLKRLFSDKKEKISAQEDNVVGLEYKYGFDRILVEGLMKVNLPNLKHMTIRGTSLTPGILAKYLEKSNIESLSLAFNVPMHADFIRDLAKARPNLKKLVIQDLFQFVNGRGNRKDLSPDSSLISERFFEGLLNFKGLTEFVFVSNKGDRLPGIFSGREEDQEKFILFLEGACKSLKVLKIEYASFIGIEALYAIADYCQDLQVLELRLIRPVSKKDLIEFESRLLPTKAEVQIQLPDGQSMEHIK